jgi:DNA-directed RNA polymerase specialized sigma24 family protein
MDTPPPPFEQLDHLAAEPATIEQAKALTAALTAIPELQKWLREQRQRVVRTLHEHDGLSYTEIAPHLGVKPERVSGIARGHSRSPKKKPADE